MSSTTSDLTDEDVMENRDPKFVEKGRIGLRLMGGHKILMRDFKVEWLCENPLHFLSKALFSQVIQRLML